MFSEGRAWYYNPMLSLHWQYGTVIQSLIPQSLAWQEVCHTSNPMAPLIKCLPGAYGGHKFQKRFLQIDYAYPTPVA